MKKAISAVFILTLFFCLYGCEKATYPKETLRESIIEVCSKEYNININAEIAGSTLAIYLPVENLFDITLNLSERAQEKIQDVLLIASRIVLSTDADIKFYCLITQDARIPQIQVIIIKYVDDVKRAFLQDISRGEYFKRTIIDINENPQAKKENAITDVFNKMKLEKDMQENVLEDFFRSPPTSLEGIGYWQGKFYIKNITLPEFLAEQIASRINFRFREDASLRIYDLKSISGHFVKKENAGSFLVDFRAESLLFIVDPVEKRNIEQDIFRNIIEESANVIYGYKFRDFDSLNIKEANYGEELVIPQNDIYLLKKRTLSMESVLRNAPAI